MREWLQKQWTTYTPWHLLLLPVAAGFGLLISLRRYLYRLNIIKSYRLAVPVIVVGNINVGGTGKTPLVIWLVRQLIAAGYRPGVISRGYKGNAQQPMHVDERSDPALVGDEPILIAMHTRCPVFTSVNRIAAGQCLLDQFPKCDVLISDDGLQHYRMQRNVEIVVYDAEKTFGNRMLLPAGPLREPVSRLKSVHAVVCNGAVAACADFENVFSMQLLADSFYNLMQPLNTVNAPAFSGKRILAVAGIGNPQRFFNQLTQMGLQFQQRAFDDHHAFIPSDFAGEAFDIVLMTEKDAVKCKAFATENFWVLPVKAAVEDGLLSAVLNQLKNSNQTYQ